MGPKFIDYEFTETFIVLQAKAAFISVGALHTEISMETFGIIH